MQNTYFRSNHSCWRMIVAGNENTMFLSYIQVYCTEFDHNGSKCATLCSKLWKYNSAATKSDISLLFWPPSTDCVKLCVAHLSAAADRSVGKRAGHEASLRWTLLLHFLYGSPVLELEVTHHHGVYADWIVFASMSTIARGVLHCLTVLHVPFFFLLLYFW